jgi:divalent metal cation (Fe/Co/Zn/Cd) transporter
LRALRTTQDETRIFHALLIGLLANVLLGWWWADPVAALVIAAVALPEGRQSWRGEGCCDTC